MTAAHILWILLLLASERIISADGFFKSWSKGRSSSVSVKNGVVGVEIGSNIVQESWGRVARALGGSYSSTVIAGYHLLSAFCFERVCSNLTPLLPNRKTTL